jgi:Ser/Thr protein kinase RdoA (MazF antagonist)
MNRSSDLHLDHGTAAAILGTAAGKVSTVDFLRPHNHTWRITADDSIYFVKAHTKDWYADAAASGVPVRHEVTGHRTLGAAGLATVEVVDFSTGTDNPLGWPYLITRRLPGDPLPDLLLSLPAEAAEGTLETVGRYLASMHALTYDQPGYLIDGPPAPPDQNQWLHWLSRPERFLLYCFETLTADAADVTLATRDAAAGLLERTAPNLRRAYQPLRFVHGDCHAGTFYLQRDDTGWRVTGVLDLENCSSGAPAFDLVKIFIELGARLGSRHCWWQPLFRGYGVEPDFDLIRTLLIGHAHINYTCHGDSHWPTRRQDVVDHILGARTWAELFDL